MRSYDKYLREATLRYVTAQDILGDRPLRLGACGNEEIAPASFDAVRESLDEDSEFLIEMESEVAGRYRTGALAKQGTGYVAVEGARAFRAMQRTYKGAAIQTSGGAVPVSKSNLIQTPEPEPEPAVVVDKGKESRPVSQPKIFHSSLRRGRPSLPSWGFSFVREASAVFCIPGNEHMMSYWDRVEDRLYKLRHCMDIDGVYRQLPLFAPPIDPALLVKGKALGLSLEDILAAGSAGVPPYRFRYLIEKARAYASTVQGFGAALLSAIEKRDAEEITRLRNKHQKNILALTSEIKRNELTVAEEGVEIAVCRQEAAKYRQEYYDALISEGNLPAEIAQNTFHALAKAAIGTKIISGIAAGAAHLLPEIGSPFAMKYGGKQAGDSANVFATVMGASAWAFDTTANVCGLVAAYQRREENWKHQKDLAKNDLKALDKEVEVARVRKELAERGLEIHQKTIEQQDEVIEFFKDKFSNLGLYTYLSKTLQQLHREAYSNALDMARLAEQAYRFERPGDDKFFVGDEWDASKSGLLAGDRLSLALQNMEKRFIETDARQVEIHQSFSITQMDPAALIELRKTGRCEFSLPEFYYDLFYPGQYRRRIRGVRLTIPCITGPYTNVSAKLTLKGSHIRKEALLGGAHLIPVPLSGAPSVAASNAQNDAGVFELSFQGEHYMPFEGAGAVSDWCLELPSSFRPFDYRTIDDVILTVSYTAEEDGVLRQKVEELNADIEGSLWSYLKEKGVTRIFSLRQEFPGAFNKLMHKPADTPISIEIAERHFPLFLQRYNLQATEVAVVLDVRTPDTVPGSVIIEVNSSEAVFSDKEGHAFGGLPSVSIGAALGSGLQEQKQHTLTIKDTGQLGLSDNNAAFDPEKLKDIILVVRYTPKL